jgi:hypothetical protein
LWHLASYFSFFFSQKSTTHLATYNGGRYVCEGKDVAKKICPRNNQPAVAELIPSRRWKPTSTYCAKKLPPLPPLCGNRRLHDGRQRTQHQSWTTRNHKSQLRYVSNYIKTFKYAQ